MYGIYVLLYIVINILNVILCIFLKFISMNIYITSKVVIKNKTVRILIDRLNYKNAIMGNLVVKINNKLFPSIKINSLELDSKYINIPEKKYENHFKLWKSSNNLSILFSYFNNIIENSKLFNVYIRKSKIILSPDTYIIIYGLNIFKRQEHKFIRFKFKTLKFYYLNKCQGLLRDLKVTFRQNKTIYIKHIHILFEKKLLNDSFINFLTNIYIKFTSNKNVYLPKLMIKSIKINLYLHNYMRFNISNLIFENNLMHLAEINIKIWKKESIWVNNFKINLANRCKSPLIEKIRLRLFNSTGDKIYKTFIILRKKFMPIHKKENKTIKYNLVDIKQNYNENYIKNTEIKENIINIDESEKIINRYLSIIDELIIDSKLKIINFTITLSNNYGNIYINNLEYKKTSDLSIIQINNWKYYKNNVIFINKNAEDDQPFIIKFNRKSISIEPYNLDIYYDTLYFTKMAIIIKKTIERINNIFYSCYYIYNKGYIYEYFYIGSFFTNFNYKKTERNFKSLMEGKKSELLNYLDIRDINILLDEIIINYPKDWNVITNKLGKVYKKSMYTHNFKNIVDKVSGENGVAILCIKENYRYLKNKIIKSIKNN